MLVQWLATIIFLPWHACLSSSGGEILSQIENVEMKENAKFSMHEGRGNKLVFRIFYGNNFLLHFHHLMQAESWQQNHQQHDGLDLVMGAKTEGTRLIQPQKLQRFQFYLKLV